MALFKGCGWFGIVYLDRGEVFLTLDKALVPLPDKFPVNAAEYFGTI